MALGSPFNVLGGPALPATVSKAYKAVWGRETDPGAPGLAGLGSYALDSPLLVLAAPFWGWGFVPPGPGQPPAEVNGYEPSQADASRFNVWEQFKETPGGIVPADGPSADNLHWIVDEYRFEFICQRLMLCQNCWVETNGETARVAPGETPRWFAPRRAALSAGAAAVRPWTVPAGDIDGWTGARLADFVPLVKSPCQSRKLRQMYANGVFAGPRENWPAAWQQAIPDGLPVAQVLFKTPPGVREAGRFRRETAAEAEDWVDGHAPDKIIYWSPVEPGDNEEDKRYDTFDIRYGVGDANCVVNGLLSQGVAPGIAFDLCVYFESWGYLHRHNTPDWSGIHLEHGGVDWTTGQSDEINHWSIAIPRFPYTFYRAASMARIVKPLPPAEGGGAS